MTDVDPWKDLAPPHESSSINARRVESSGPLAFYWARGVDNHCLLVMRHSPASSPKGRLPQMRGLEMTLSDDEDSGTRMLVLRLLEAGQRDIFHRLCLDLVSSAEKSKTEAEALTVALTRTWRWHHLLRGGGDGRLEPEAQKGLIGELIVFEQIILAALPAPAAVASWHGPLGAPKDFEVGRVCLEAKARRGAATPYVAISSEFQLDVSGIDVLFLHVAELDQELVASKEGFTLTEVAERCRMAVGERDRGGLERFEELLQATGFRWEDDYNDFRWVAGHHRVFRVSDGFPAITTASCPTGVTNIRYSISLIECEPFRSSESEIAAVLKGNHVAN